MFFRQKLTFSADKRQGLAQRAAVFRAGFITFRSIAERHYIGNIYGVGYTCQLFQSRTVLPAQNTGVQPRGFRGEDQVCRKFARVRRRVIGERRSFSGSGGVFRYDQKCGSISDKGSLSAFEQEIRKGLAFFPRYGIDLPRL